MSDSRVSVVLCTFNGARYLQEQLQSIAGQTLSPVELIICDDQSTDDTVGIAKSFAAKGSFPVRIYVNEERLGPAQNFAKGLALAQGDIIVFSDQDDIWKSHKLAKIVEAFAASPDAVYVFSDAEMVDENGGLLGQKFWDAVEIRQRLHHFTGPGQIDVLLKHNLVSGATMAFRASFREVVLPIPAGWMHDYWIVMLGSALSRGLPLDEALFQYRRHAAQVCGWRKHTYLQVLRKSFETNYEDSWKKVEIFRELEGRILLFAGARPCPAECLRLIREKEAHLTTRAKIRSSKGFAKFGMWLQEAVTGRYQRFSDSWHSIVRDLS